MSSSPAPSDRHAHAAASPLRYEADERGNVYEVEDGSVWPTGVVVRVWASRNDITQEEFDRQLRFLDQVRRV